MDNGDEAELLDYDPIWRFIYREDQDYYDIFYAEEIISYDGETVEFREIWADESHQYEARFLTVSKIDFYCSLLHP